MEKCWECYGKKWLQPERIAQSLSVFTRSSKIIESQDDKEYVWILVPLFTVSEQNGLPTLMKGSHLNPNGQNHRPYHPIVQPGHALMFENRIRTCEPTAGGGVVFATGYDMASK